MDKHISDLFDSFEYSPIKTETKAEEVSVNNIKELTMMRIQNEPTRKVTRVRRRNFAATLAAAVALTMMCGAAYATNAFGVREHFDKLFSDSGTQMQTDDLRTLEEIYEKSEGGMQAVTSNGTTMTPTAAIYDKDRYYLAIDITAPESVILEREGKDYEIPSQYDEQKNPIATETEFLYSFWQVWGDTYEESAFVTDKDGNLIGYVESTMFSNENSDNKLTVIMRICLSDADKKKTEFGDGKEKLLTLYGLWLQSPDKIYTNVLQGEFVFDLERGGVSGEIPE